MDVIVRRRYNAVVEDSIIVKGLAEGPQMEQELKQKIDAGQFEFDPDFQILGDEASAEILQIDPIDDADTAILKNM